MTVEELSKVITDSNLDPYEIAGAVYWALEERFQKDFDYVSVTDIKRNADFMLFYLAAKQLKD